MPTSAFIQMPRYLITLSLAAFAATVFTLLLMAFGPRQGLETLATGLVAYFTLLFHIAIGPFFVVHWARSKRLTIGSGLVMSYLLLIYGIGAWQFIVVNDLDDAAADFVAAQRNPDAARLRELGDELFIRYKFKGGVSAGDLAAWHRLAGNARDVNQRDSAHKAPLWYAAAIGDAEMVNLLLKAGAVTDDKALYETTPLAVAIEEGHHEAARVLLQAGANPDEGINKHYPSLALAARNADAAMIELLLAAGADVNLGDPAPFSQALQQGRSDMVSRLLDADAQPVLYLSYQLPMEAAMAAGDEAMVAVLIAKAGGFELGTAQRDPYLFQALHRCNLQDFRRALELGADPDVRNHKGASILQQLILPGMRDCNDGAQRAGFAAALVAAGADVNTNNERGDPLLLLAFQHQRPMIARLLIDAGASLAGELQQKDFLMWAAGAGADDLVRIALARGFDPDRWSEAMNTSNALHEAARAGHSATVRLLLASGATLPHQSIRRRNLFRFAADHPESLRELLSRYTIVTRDAQSDLDVKSSVSASNNATSIAMLTEYGIR
ncbi:MAG: ankyrin repeat domain-containing protein [Gammaproteobacteria bacterium]|nr:ankyrin repeat domain-containing protein [Gammaproteobacteria bacterium]